MGGWSGSCNILLLKKNIFSEQLKINVYHPFPEGNGRTQRIFISSLSNMFQYSLDWSNAHPWEIVETSKKVHERNYKPLEELIRRIIRDENKP